MTMAPWSVRTAGCTTSTAAAGTYFSPQSFARRAAACRIMPSSLIAMSRWSLLAPVSRAWSLMTSAEEWPTWWTSVATTQLDARSLSSLIACWLIEQRVFAFTAAQAQDMGRTLRCPSTSLRERHASVCQAFGSVDR